MAWETRKRGGRYYTRTRRENGRLVREYVGGGIVGLLAEWGDEQARQERERQREAWRKEQERIRVSEAPSKVLKAACDRLMWAALEDAGYHNHRGEWRKRP